MQFYDFPTTRDVLGAKDVPVGEFYAGNFSFAAGLMKDTCTALQMVSEGTWEKHRRPYYSVWPSIGPMLMRLNLAVDTQFVRPPVPAFMVRLPMVEHPVLEWEWGGRKWHVRSILVGPAVLRNGEASYDGLMLWVNTGEVRRMPDDRDYPVHTYINLPLQTGMTLDEALAALPFDPSAFAGLVMPKEVRADCARLVCTICLLDNDPNLIEPDVLAKDRGKPLTQTVIDRAHRRGKIGWDIGKHIEVIPHVRRPHPALMHTGHGRTVPKVVLRKGCVVHRDTVMKLPTGYEGNGEEI